MGCSRASCASHHSCILHSTKKSPYEGLFSNQVFVLVISVVRLCLLVVLQPRFFLPKSSLPVRWSVGAFGGPLPRAAFAAASSPASIHFVGGETKGSVGICKHFFTQRSRQECLQNKAISTGGEFCCQNATAGGQPFRLWLDITSWLHEALLRSSIRSESGCASVRSSLEGGLGEPHDRD